MLKYLLILMAIAFGSKALAQDTLKKVLEYDMRIENATTLDVPWLQAYIATAGKKKWVEKLFAEMTAGTRTGYEDASSTKPLRPEWFVQGFEGHVDTFYVVDPIKLEEHMELVKNPPWDLKNITGLRIRRTEFWTDDKGNSMVYFQMALLYDYYDREGVNRGKWAMFWIYIN